MIRTQIYLPAKHLGALRREAREAGVSMTEVVRRVVAEHVQGTRRVPATRKEAALAFVGLGASGRADTSERHDEALDEALRAADLR